MAHVAPPRIPVQTAPSRRLPKPAVAPRAGWADSPVLHALAALVYLAAFWQIYEGYLSVVWGYTGLIYRPLSGLQMLFVAAGVTISAYCLPTRLRTPSSLIVWLLFAFVYVPTMVQTMMLGERAPEHYLAALGALTLVMAGSGLASRRWVPPVGSRSLASTVPLLPSQTVTYGLLIVFAVITLALIVVYRSIMTFADISSSEDVYAARFAAADMTSGLLGYVRAYYTYVFSPALLAIGLLVPRRRWFVAAALVGFVVSYMIDGSKISLILPVAVAGVWAVLRYARAATAAMTGAMAALTLVFGFLAERLQSLSFVADLILFRSIAIPGQQFALYYDLFESRGYTFWSNVRGISLFVPPPAGFASDPRWPVLGQIVGEEYFGFSSRTNSNANPFAGEGVAAAGPIGVVVIGLALLVYLRVLDRAAVGWDRRFALYALVPVGFALTNVHLSTTLVSFGGAFWVLFLMFLRPPTAPRPPRPRAPWAVRRR